jgi:chromosome segregation ATPase
MTATIEDLERRVTALETAQNDTTQTLRWVVSRLGKMSAVQDEHTLRLDRIDSRLDHIDSRLDRMDSRLDHVDGRLDRIDSRLDRVEADLKGLRADLPAMLTEAVREGLKRLSD